MVEGQPAAVRAHVNGAHLAAIMGASLGLLTLGIVQTLSELDPAFNEFVFSVGKAWMPGATGIGPYSGKETLMVVAWLGSWALFHLLWRKRAINPRVCFGLCLLAILGGVLGVWPPVWHALGA